MRNKAFQLMFVCLFLGLITFSLVKESSKPPINESFVNIYKADNEVSSFNSAVVMDLPKEFRQENYSGGSCVHAATISLLRWQGQFDMANWWKDNYYGGESISRLTRRMDAAELKFAYTSNGDFSFIRWCVRTGRGAGIFYKYNHAINLVGMDENNVYLLDNNNINYPEHNGKWETVPIETFKDKWVNNYGGVAWTLVYYPPAPLPIQ